MKPIAFASALGLALALCGCATTLSDADRKAIQAVSVSPKVAMPAHPMVAGPSVNKGGLLLGPIGMAAMMNSENEDSAAFRKHLEENKIDVGEIVRQEFVAQLTAGGLFPSVVPEGGQAKFELVVENYGLAPGFSMAPINKPLRAHLTVAGKLLDPNGKVLWESKGQLIAINSELPAWHMNDWLTNGERTRDALQKTAVVVVKELVESLKPGS